MEHDFISRYMHEAEAECAAAAGEDLSFTFNRAQQEFFDRKYAENLQRQMNAEAGDDILVDSSGSASPSEDTRDSSEAGTSSQQPRRSARLLNVARVDYTTATGRRRKNVPRRSPTASIVNSTTNTQSNSYSSSRITNGNDDFMTVWFSRGTPHHVHLHNLVTYGRSIISQRATSRLEDDLSVEEEQREFEDDEDMTRQQQLLEEDMGVYSHEMELVEHQSRKPDYTSGRLKSPCEKTKKKFQGTEKWSKEFGPCTLCFEETPFDMVGCSSCHMPVGCRHCTQRWVASDKQDHGQARCPLCRIAWKGAQGTRSMKVLKAKNLWPRQ